jgi:hypothetical protein
MNEEKRIISKQIVGNEERLNTTYSRLQKSE